MIEGSAEGESAARTHEFHPDTPVEIDVALGSGRVEVSLFDGGPEGEPAPSAVPSPVTVEVTHDRRAQSPWAQGMASMVDWVSQQFGEQLGAELRGSPDNAVANTRVEMIGNRVVVRAPDQLPLRHIPLAVTVRAAAGSQLTIDAGSAQVAVSGTCGSSDITTGAAEVTVDRADGPLSVQTSSGAITLGSASAGQSTQLRTGSGAVRVSELSAATTIVTGNGHVWVGHAHGDLLGRSGSGNLSIADLSAGTIELLTGSGDVHVGMHSGTHAEVDLSSGSGTVSSDLEVSDTPPDNGVAARVNARTRSGRATVSRAPTT